LEARLQESASKWIVQVFSNDNIGRILKQVREKRPARRLWFKVVSLAAAMLDEDHLAGLRTNLVGELIDALDDAASRVWVLRSGAQPAYRR
jgi:hypothetical protein